MLVNNINKNEFNISWASYLTEYATILNSLVTIHRNEEYSTGTSTAPYNVILFHSSFIYLYLVSVEFKLGIQSSKSYYYNKYGLDCLSSKLACIGISITKVLSILDVVLDDSIVQEDPLEEEESIDPGISGNIIGYNFVIGNIFTNIAGTKYPIDIADLYTMPTTCFNIFD